MRARIAVVAPLFAAASLLGQEATSTADSPPPPVEAHTEPAPPPEPPPPSVCDPDEYRRLQAGHGHPVAQHWHNSLRTDGGEPDYLRYHLACEPDDRHWSTAEYWCAHKLLSDEHGGKPWSPTRLGARGPAGQTGGIPQAYPWEKMASHGPDWRTNGRVQIEWFKDYVEERYRGGVFQAGCSAGY